MQRWIWIVIALMTGIVAPPVLLWRILTSAGLTGSVDWLAVMSFLIVGLIGVIAATKLGQEDSAWSKAWSSVLLMSGIIVQAVPLLLFGRFSDHALPGFVLWCSSCAAISAIILSPLVTRPRRESTLIAAILCLAANSLFALNTLTVAGLTGEGRISLKWRTGPPSIQSVANRPAVESQPVDNLLPTSRIVWQQYSDYVSEAAGSVDSHTERGMASEWWNTLEARWTVPVGKSWSSVAVTEHRIFTQEQLDGQDQATCRSLETGDLLWAVPHDAHPYRSAYGGDGPRSTPGLCEVLTSDGKLRQAVIAAGPHETVMCLAADNGQRIWKADLSQLGSGDELPHGLSISPLITGELVIVGCSRSQAPCLVALDRHSGKQVWEVRSDWKSSYSSPILADLCGVQQILFHAGPGVLGVNPETGDVLWQYEWSNEHQTNASMPVIVNPREGIIAVSSGYGTGVSLIKVVKGDSDSWSVNTLWTSNALKTKFSSCCLFDHKLVGLDDGILAAVDLDSGRRLWKKGRYRFGQNLQVGSQLAVLTEDGELVVLLPEFNGPKELFRQQVIQGKCWSPPVIMNGMVVVRNDESMVMLTTSRDRQSERQK